MQLNEAQKRKLHYLLDNEKNKPFTLAHITRIIEPILMPATKKLMIEKIKEDFFKKPEDTSLYAAVSYGFIYHFKLQAGEGSELASLLADNNFDNKDYTEAEIFRVNGITAAIKECIRKNYEIIFSEYTKKAEELPDEKKTSFHKSILLEGVLRSKIKDFFTENDNYYLNRYTDHLNTDNRWGTEDSLNILHSKITGERMVGESDAKKAEYDHQLHMEIYRNGVPTISHSSHSPDIILNNVNNYHWVSLVDVSKNTPLSEKEQRNNLLDIPNANEFSVFTRQ